MTKFEHLRHKEPTPIPPRELVVVCAPLRSNVNLSRIVRTAACCGVGRLIACGSPRIDTKIARDGLETLEVEIRRSPLPALERLRTEGYRLVGLEQTTGATNLHEYRFQRKTALVIGNERTGLTDGILAVLDDVVEIPVYGRPFSFNVATAASMALYEFCRQFPEG